MVSFEDPSVLGDFLNSQLDQPIQYKIDSTGRYIYRSHSDFGSVRNIRRILPKIVDFGGSIKFDREEEWGIYPIQPDHYRAPEVILGCGWKTSADIWNLGILVRIARHISLAQTDRIANFILALGSHPGRRTILPDPRHTGQLSSKSPSCRNDRSARSSSPRVSHNISLNARVSMARTCENCRW